MTRRKWAFDETFMELTLEDIKEGIEAVAYSRAKRPQDRVTQLHTPAGRISITVRREPPQ